MVDVNEGYRRRRVHSAGEEACLVKWGDRLYLWAPGPRSLGNRERSALKFVSMPGRLVEACCVWDVSDGTDHE